MKLTNINEEWLRECADNILKYVCQGANLEYPPEYQRTDILKDLEEIILEADLLDED